MSNIYIQEPPTHGKALLKTTVGDIDIELWSKEAPKACRNFVQLCLEGYYDNTIFHRVVPNFIVQGGDPTETGEGGESVYGAPFKDEFHSRLRFVRRGLVAMANSGPNDNGSQFFFTMKDTPELQNKHTIFGKVVGDTLFNMLKLQEVEVGANERPLEPHKILHTEILFNPFDDIIPRQLKRGKKDKEDEKKIKSKSRATKNFCLLSFGEEAQEDEEQVDKATESFRGKSKSSHDLTDDPRLSSVPAVEREISEEKKKLEAQVEEVKKKPEPLEEDTKSNKSETEDSKKKRTEQPEEEIKKKIETGEDTKKKKEDPAEDEKKKRRSDTNENDGKKKKSETAAPEAENDGAKKKKADAEEEKKKVKVEDKEDRVKKRKPEQQQEVVDDKKRKKTDEMSDDKKRKRKEDAVEEDRRKRKTEEQDQDSRRKRKPEEEKEEGKKKKKTEEEAEAGSRPSEDQRGIKEDVRKKLKKEREDSPKVKETKPVTESQEDSKKSSSARMEELKKEARKLQKDIKESKKRIEDKEETKVPKLEDSEKTLKKDDDEDTSEENDLLAMVKKERQKYKSRKRLLEKKEDREANTMALLAKFQSRLTNIRTVAGDYDDEEDKDREDEEDVSDMSWMRHRLHFEEEVQKTKVIDANVPDSDRYELSDPRNPMTQRRRENSKKAMRSKR